MWIETKRGRVRQTRAPDHRDRSAGYRCRARLAGFPRNERLNHGVWQSNVNLLTENKPPYDPAMGTYQLRALLCRVALAEPE